MKKLSPILCVLLFILVVHGPVYAQDFTVQIPSTDNCGHYITPIKAGGSHQFQINVKNNRADTCTVSIDKSLMGTVSSWVSIDNNSQQIFPSQSVNFLLTINVPAGTPEINYAMSLYFNAKDKDNNNHSFQYDAQWIIVDNSLPLAPTFTVSQTSTTIFVDSWSSWDERSNVYTLQNSSAGVGGIKTYKVDIKNPGGTIAKTITKNADDYHYYTFTNLSPNTNYTACVTANDLVGFTKTTEKAATTAPAKPSGLAFSNTTYINTSLSWSASAGATGYNVYKVTGSTNTKLNSSPITGTSYNIVDLDPNTTYAFNVIALSNVGPSDRSDNASVTTLALPSITGPSQLCTGTTYTVQNLLAGYSVSWSNSSNISMQSASGNSANFVKVSDGTGWIDASITAPNARVLALDRKEIYVGAPFINASSIVFTNEESSTGNLCSDCFGNTATVTLPCDFDYLDVKLTNLGETQIISEFTVTGSGSGAGQVSIILDAGVVPSPGTYMFCVRGINDCGTGNWAKKGVTYENCGLGGLSLVFSPNPTRDETIMTIESKLESSEFDENEEWTMEVYSKNQMMRVKNIKQKGKRHTLNTSSWKKGMYLVRVKYKNEVLTGKLIVER